MTQPALEPAPQVTPQPLPTTVSVAGVHATGPAGVTVVFLPPDTARQVAGLLQTAALQVRSGLIVPAGVLPGNGGRPQR
jgi:hypothetical protein